MTTKTKNNRPTFRIMVEYTKPDGNTGLREAGVLWKWTKNKSSGFTGHVSSELKEGQRVVLFAEAS